MRRVSIESRKDYIKKIEELGFNFHSDPELGTYYKEDAVYEFTMEEIEEIEKATNEAYRMYCDAAEYVINYDLYDVLHIPETMWGAIKESWERDDLSLLGRFDFMISREDGKPKILEFNSDTPSLEIESSILQWSFKEEMFPEADQFNSIHEHLVNSWVDIHQRYNSPRYYFACCRESLEDHETLQYLISTAMEAGLNTAELEMEQLLYDETDNCLYSPGGERIETCFKLYPYEWIFSENIEAAKSKIHWIEPLWKSIMSNKALLPIIYQLFPDSPYVLPCKVNPVGMKSYCKKPIFSREGANITLVKDGKVIEESTGEYGEEGYVYQELVDVQPYDGYYPLIGSFVIGGEACGMGIRDTKTKITDNMSLFTPHIII